MLTRTSGVRWCPSRPVTFRGTSCSPYSSFSAKTVVVCLLESNGSWLIVRGAGLIESVEDVKRIVVGASNGVPIYVEQVADVHIGNAFRVATLVKGTQEAVGGVWSRAQGSTRRK